MIITAERTDEAISALETSVWSMFSQLGRGDGGTVVDSPHRLQIHTPVTRPPYNGVFRFHDDGRPLREQVRETLVQFSDSAGPLMWLVHPTIAQGIEAELSDAGLVQVDVLRGMHACLDDLPHAGDVPSGIRVVEEGPDDADAWVHLVTWRYGLDDTTSDYLHGVYRVARANGTRLWVAYDGDEPISKAAIHVADRTAGVYGVATTEAGRGKGLARHLTLLALHAAGADGIEDAVLHSTPMAFSLYEKMGFRDVAPFGVWAAPGELHI